MRKGFVAGGFVVLAMSAAATLPQWLEPAGPAVAAETPVPPPVSPGVPVTAGTVVAADVPVILNGIGSVQAYNMVTIKSRVDGQIMKVGFTEGQEVKAGTPLFQIDPRPYQATLEQAQAAKEKDQVQLANAQTDLARYSQLVGSGYQTRQSYDQQKALVAQFQAAIKGDEAQIDAAQLNLAYADIRAPIDGRLGARLVDQGNLVRATDATGLVTITQLQPIFVTFTVPQNNIDKLREAQAKAPLEVQAYSADDKKMLSDGKLTLIDNTVDQATGTIRLKATFANTDEKLWPGQFANMRVVLSTRKGAATVPQRTVQVGPNGYYAYVIKPDNTVERRPVDIAATQNGIVVVSKGLSIGEKVVVDGQYRLTDGARVRESAPAQAPAPGAS
ncbi:MAG TPA: efflux RND transporter periplasmic adaptor subunit [Stellaceae bacterium]|jgi:multidrug efflux system membrane fusion protein|nr:efflux RND transporter periplasmic adaptor subunit [Stellaceae bacterium]